MSAVALVPFIVLLGGWVLFLVLRVTALDRRLTALERARAPGGEG